MKIIVTCGPSYEPIDQARRITNFSTGRLGIALANHFAAQHWEVICLKGEQATCPAPLHGPELISFSTNESLAEQLRALARERAFDAVFHAAALCDFRVGQVLNEEGQPIDSPKFASAGALTLQLVPTLKVLPHLREWFPQARLAGWKYELAGTREEAFKKAWRQIRDCQTDACILNGSAYGEGYALCRASGKVDELVSLDPLAARLVDWLESEK
jgi:phosphopantothenate---cysteine ligase (CTP)